MSEETALIPFDFEDHKVRGMQDEHGDPWIAATDACEALGISNVSDAVSRLPDDEKAAIVTTDTAGRPNKLLFVNEAGLYRLIFTSRKAEAERFKKWVFSEVLPTIRKTGQYTAKSLTPLEQLEATVAILRAAEQRMTAIEAAQQDQDQRLHVLESHIQGEQEHFTILGYCKLRGLPVPSRNDAQSMGQRATKLSKVMGQSTGKTTDPRHGTVNTYHISVLDELFKPNTQLALFEGK